MAQRTLHRQTYCRLSALIFTRPLSRWPSLCDAVWVDKKGWLKGSRPVGMIQVLASSVKTALFCHVPPFPRHTPIDHPSTRSRSNRLENGRADRVDVHVATMSSSTPWPRPVWRRPSTPPGPKKSCTHPLCPWQTCELRLYALFWAENPIFLDIYEEPNHVRRKELLDKAGLTLDMNHITIVQYCDGKRQYRFSEDRSVIDRADDWMRTPGAINKPLIKYFKPMFEVIYEHRGCFFDEDSAERPIIVCGIFSQECLLPKM